LAEKSWCASSPIGHAPRKRGHKKVVRKRKGGRNSPKCNFGEGIVPSFTGIWYQRSRNPEIKKEGTVKNGGDKKDWGTKVFSA